jgi:hypothetical protein
MTHRIAEPSRIPGWGIDADPRNDPTYPIKQRTNGEHQGYTWARPTQQNADVEVLHSNERPNLTAVFGTSLPPSGLSGVLRRAAFGYSESSYGHWLPLMLADRIDMIGGLVEDLMSGHLPNIPAERGWRAAWTHDRSSQIYKLGVAAILLTAAVSSVRHRGR